MRVRDPPLKYKTKHKRDVNVVEVGGGGARGVIGNWRIALGT